MSVNLVSPASANRGVKRRGGQRLSFTQKAGPLQYDLAI